MMRDTRGEAEIAGLLLHLGHDPVHATRGSDGWGGDEVLVGRAVGVLDRPRVVESAAAALACGLLFMAATAAVFLSVARRARPPLHH